MQEKYELAIGNSRNDTHWKGFSLTWAELAERCMKVVRTGETFVVYQSSDLDFKQSKKDVGGFVSGSLKDGRRRKDSILDKQILTLDLDDASPDFVARLRSSMHNMSWIYYSTHSHSPEKPRYRLLLPLSRRVVPVEYEPIARWVANFFGIEQFDATGYDINRLMYWPSAADDGAFEADWQNGATVDVDYILQKEYGGQFADVTKWPMAPGEFKAVREHAQDKMQDPHTKPGVIGAFCRMYTTRQLLDTLLSHIYAPSGDPNRYTYRQGSVSNGLWVIDDKFVFSWHNTDPMGGAPTNVFDMYRIHLCGGAEDVPGKRIEDQKSTKQALAQIRNMREIKLAKFREDTGYESPNAMFNAPNPQQLATRSQIQPQVAQNMWQQNIVADAPVPQNVVQPLVIQPLNGHSALNGHSHAPTAAMGNAAAQAPANLAADADDYWKGDLEVDGRMKPLANVKNVELIFENDPRIKGCFGRDIFAKQIVLRGMVPWIVPGRTAQWTDIDDDALINFFGRHYGINSADIIRRVLNEVTAKYGFHPVKEYLESLVWDGVPRIEQLFHYFLGVEDNHYTRQVSRKWFTAAVTRIYEPGRKFDYMPVFVGKAGLGKSYLIDKLGGKWFSDTSVDLRNKKESMEELQGVWIMEWGELTSFRTASIEAVKAFVSKRKDRYRAAYARRTEEHPRQLVFAGSTNVPKFLSDPDGNRRFWPLYVNQVPIQRTVHEDFTEELRGQLWAEACYMYAQGESLMLDEQARLLAEQVQTAHTETDARELAIIEYINRPVPLNWHEMFKGERAAFLGLGDFGSQPPADVQQSGAYAPRNKVSVTEIWVECLGGEIKHMTKQATRIIQDVMRNLDDWAYSKNQLYFGAFPRDRGFVRKDSGIKVRTGAENES